MAVGDKRLLLVWHSRTGLAEQMADAMEDGAWDAARQMGVAVSCSNSPSHGVGTGSKRDRLASSPKAFQVVRRTAYEVTSADVLSADGYLFCAPENLATVSGAMKEFFDRTYYDMFLVEEGTLQVEATLQVEGATRNTKETSSSGGYDEVPLLLGRPFALAIAAGSDGWGAAAQVERICRGWRLQPVAETFVHRNGQPQTAAAIKQPKQCTDEGREKCRTLGGLVAATMLLADD